MSASGGRRELRSFLEGRQKLAFNLDTRSKHDAHLQRFVTGATSCKRGGAYRPVDFDGLLRQARAARQRDGKRLARVKQLSKKGKLSRECGLLRVHKELWETEQARLQTQREEVEEELDQWRGRVGASGGQFWRDFLDEAAAEDARLYSQRQDFFEHTVQPLWTLKIELKTCLEREGKSREDASSLFEEVRAVLDDWKSIQELLEEEFRQVWDEVTTLCVAEDGETGEGGGERVRRDTPLELSAEQEGAEEASYDSAVRELQLLDDHYQNALETLHNEYEMKLSLKDGGWSTRDAERFHHIMCQYPMSLPQRRTLLIDRLTRELPHKTRAEIISQETWHCTVSHYHAQKSTLTKSWQRHRTELVYRLVAMVREQKQLLQAQAVTSAAREEQRRRATELHVKVCAWREERQAAQLQQEAERARQRERREDERRREEQKMAEHRDKLKAKLEVYHSQRRREGEREREEQQRRRRERELQRKEEGRRGRERVDHRQRLLRARQEREEAARERAMEAVCEREERLDQLRKKVEVTATRDPLRVLTSTKALEMRLSAATDTQLETQHPLFTLHGYHDDEVTSDPRFKVAAALQEAGLLDTAYARRVLATVPPSHRTRPEQQSSIFKQK